MSYKILFWIDDTWEKKTGKNALKLRFHKIENIFTCEHVVKIYFTGCDMCMIAHTSNAQVIPLGQLKSNFWVGPEYLYKISLIDSNAQCG